MEHTSLTLYSIWDLLFSRTHSSFEAAGRTSGQRDGFSVGLLGIPCYLQICNFRLTQDRFTAKLISSFSSMGKIDTKDNGKTCGLTPCCSNALTYQSLKLI